jgi:ABC-type polysaccharide/polyol phosphate transport system ATPase subunit
MSVGGSEELVVCEGLSKRFCRDLKKSLWYGLKDIAAESVGRRSGPDHLREGEFWALKDVSFTVRRGEMLALVGVNGSGKSTLLKMLNGLMKPDGGSLTMRGEVQALIELGAGFNPILSGRENIRINASVLGLRKAQIDRVMPDIIEFAGLEDFIDAPVQNYSSGMKARLGFSVVTQLDPDVLLIDEVLAVGDTAFQEKCMRRMDALRNSDKAIVFVTHSLFQVEALCDSALWLEHGKVREYGSAHEVVRSYLNDQEERAMRESAQEGVMYQGRGTAATRAFFDKRDAAEPEDAPPPVAEEAMIIHSVQILDEDGCARTELPFLSPCTVRVEFECPRPIHQPLFNVRFFHGENDVFEASMLIDGPGPMEVQGHGVVECSIPLLPLTPRVYKVQLFVRSGDGIADLIERRFVTQFRVTDERLETVPLAGPMAIGHLRRGSPVYVPRTWRFYSNGELTQTVEATYGKTSPVRTETGETEPTASGPTHD